MADEYRRLQEAIFERFESTTPWGRLATKYRVGSGIIRRSYDLWSAEYPETQPQSSNEKKFVRRSPGRPCKLKFEEEMVITDAITQYAENNAPLSRSGVRDLVQDYVEMLSISRQQQVNFTENRPSDSWIDDFMVRHNLQCTSVQIIEDKRVNAVSPKNITEHLARVQSTIDRYHIKEARFIFNNEQSGASLYRTTGRSLRKGLTESGAKKVVQLSVKTKGKLYHVTIMSVVSAAGVTYKPALVYPGKLAHYRKVNGQKQSLHSVHPPCYLYQRDPGGVDSAIFYDWAQGFLSETECLRQNNQQILLVLDGYGAHVQYRSLKMLADNNVEVLALPAHTSHVSQPLDVSVFGEYMSYLQQEVYRASRQNQCLDAFDVVTCIRNAYIKTHMGGNICSGFYRTGIWDPSLLSTNMDALKTLFKGKKDVHARVSVEDLPLSFRNKHCTLLRDADVEENGRVRIKTTSGVNLTSEAVISALERRGDNRRNLAQGKKDSTIPLPGYKEPRAYIRCLVVLAPQRDFRRQRLTSTCNER